ncbi:MAG: transglycosylase SLT domain-containing protein [Thiohalobacteraceae bacterium]
MQTILRNFLAALFVLSLTPAAAAADRYADDRAQFLEARKASKAGQTQRFERLEAELREYPLYSYLRYDRITANLARARDAEVREFLDDYANSPLSERLRRSWLYHLARQHEWTRFQDFYAADQADVELQCYHLRATRRDPPAAEWLDAATTLWLVGRSQPDSCDPVFKVLIASPRMTEELVWTRIGRAMEANAPSLASFLARMLPADERSWVEVWREVHQHPSRARDLPALRKDTLRSREILAHAAARLARNDALAAHQWWTSIREDYAFSPEQLSQTQRLIALQAGYKRLPEAHRLLAEVPEPARDRSVREWQARSALLHGDWPAVAAAVDSMPADERKVDEWRYWWAQAQSALGDSEAATLALRALAEERSYHGFLAADILGQDYRMLHRSISATDAELEQLQREHPALLRAGELLRADLIYDARREWFYGARELSGRELQLAAVLAHRWNWHDRAIMTAGRSDHQDDLDLRFPVLYANEVQRIAAQLDMDPSWIFGIMRQESAFMADARSPAGALGLMQLMPATGAEVARMLKLPKPSARTLLQADANIRLGSNYLKQALDKLGNKVLATAAYNAGPHRVRGWLPTSDPLPTPRWVDTIPFTETRGYVRGVLAFATVYDARLERPITPLSRRMPDLIQPPRR